MRGDSVRSLRYGHDLVLVFCGNKTPVCASRKCCLNLRPQINERYIIL